MSTDDRILEQRARQRADLSRERGREEQCLIAVGQQVDDAPDVGQEAHVEHPVGLVQDEDLDLAQVDACAARRGRAGGPGVATRISTPAQQRLGLRLDRHAAVDDGVAQRHVLAVRPERVVDLDGELARRRQDQRADRMACGREAGVGVRAQPLEAWAARKPRSCPCRSGHGPSRRGPGQPAGWPVPGWGWVSSIALLADGAQDFRAQPEIVKRQAVEFLSRN